MWFRKRDPDAQLHDLLKTAIEQIVMETLDSEVRTQVVEIRAAQQIRQFYALAAVEYGLSLEEVQRALREAQRNRSGSPHRREAYTTEARYDQCETTRTFYEGKGPVMDAIIVEPSRFARCKRVLSWIWHVLTIPHPGPIALLKWLWEKRSSYERRHDIG